MKSPPVSRPKRRPGGSLRAGFSLVDVCVGLAILAVAIGALVGSLFQAMRQQEANEETAAATQHARRLLEGMHALSIAEIYAAYNSDRSDDPRAGHDYLADLEIDDPLLVVGKKTGPTVEITFPGDPEADLAANHLTLALRLEWEGSSGRRAVEVTTTFRDS